MSASKQFALQTTISNIWSSLLIPQFIMCYCCYFIVMIFVTDLEVSRGKGKFAF